MRSTSKTKTSKSEFGVETVIAKAKAVAEAKITRAKELAKQQATLWESQLNDKAA